MPKFDQNKYNSGLRESPSIIRSKAGELYNILSIQLFLVYFKMTTSQKIIISSK